MGSVWVPSDGRTRVLFTNTRGFIELDNSYKIWYNWFMMITILNWLITLGLIAFVIIGLIITIDEVNHNGSL